MGRAAKAGRIVGAMDHAGSAVLVTVGPGGAFVDRRRVTLVDDGLPSMPHHHEGQKLPLDEAVALVGHVRISIERNAKARLEALAAEVPGIVGIALRALPSLPETVAERITSYRAMCVADWVMVREALAGAAVALGWSVHAYDAKRVFGDAAKALGRRTVDDLLDEIGGAIGPPWQKDHKLATAAAIAASASA